MLENWRLIKNTDDTVIYLNIKTKQRIVGTKEYMGYGKYLKWYPMFVNTKFINGLHYTFTKDGIMKQLIKYMKKHP